MKDDVVLVASIGRGHALAKRLSETASVHSFLPFANPGIIACSKDYQIGNIVDPRAVAAYAKKIDPEYVFIAPDDPIAAGAANAVMEAGFAAIAPVKEVARLESDKAFARQFMKEYVKGGCPRFDSFTDPDLLSEYVDSIDFHFVVKPAGLTGGKGVKVQGQQFSTKEEGKAYALECLKSGTVVIEEKLEGEEFSFQVFVDGKSFKPMPLAQDHKHAFEGDTGPMTGGMGSYSCENHRLPFVTEQDYEHALEVVRKTVEGIRRKTGQPYTGILYAQLMLTKNGPFVIEYNCRFGDPEAENVLPLLKTPLHSICKAVAEENLEGHPVEFEKRAAVCKYVVPNGYPGKKERFRFTPMDEAAVKAQGVELFYSGVEKKADGLYTTGSRGFAVTAKGTDVPDAFRTAESALSKMDLEGFRYRKDIASPESLARKVDRMRRLVETDSF